MLFTRHRILFTAIGSAWIASVAFGVSLLWAYQATPSTAGQPPVVWPVDSSLSRATGKPTLVMLAHPHCPCSRASIAELAQLMTDCRGKLSATVLLLRPPGMPDGWERTDLWDSAAAIPGVEVVSDPDGLESQRFGAATSGTVFLYGTDGKLLFNGGITESRGHRGDNAGRSAITALVLDQTPQLALTPVFGCPLFDQTSVCQFEGTPACHTK